MKKKVNVMFEIIFLESMSSKMSEKLDQDQKTSIEFPGRLKSTMQRIDFKTVNQLMIDFLSERYA